MSINSTGIDKPTSVHICTHFKSSNREKSLFFYAKWTDGQIPLFPARENSSRPVRALHPDIYIYLIDLIKYAFQLPLCVIQKGHQDAGLWVVAGFVQHVGKFHERGKDTDSQAFAKFFGLMLGHETPRLVWVQKKEGTTLPGPVRPPGPHGHPDVVPSQKEGGTTLPGPNETASPHGYWTLFHQYVTAPQ